MSLFVHAPAQPLDSALKKQPQDWYQDLVHHFTTTMWSCYGSLLIIFCTMICGEVGTMTSRPMQKIRHVRGKYKYKEEVIKKMEHDHPCKLTETAVKVNSSLMLCRDLMGARGARLFTKEKGQKRETAKNLTNCYSAL